MKSHFGDLVVYRGNKFVFLRMEITITKDKRVKIEIKDQLMEDVALFESCNDTKVNEIVTSPAQKHLRLVNEDCKNLSGTKHELFHSIVEKLLFITKRVRPDLEISIEHICTRATKSNEDSWKKLRRIIVWVK